MHDRQMKQFKHLAALLSVTVLSVCLLLPATAQAYGGSGGARSATDDPNNNRVFDDESPSVPSTHFAGDPTFAWDPAAIPDKSGENFWHSDECIGLLTVLDYGGSVACFFIPGYGWFKAIHLAGKAYAFSIDENKQKKAWSVLSWIGNKSKAAYSTVKNAASGAYTRVKNAFSGSSGGRSSGGVGTGNTASK